MHDRLAFLQAKLLQHGIHALGAEDAHEIVFQREEELGGARVALAAGAAAKLVVDAPTLVALRADDEEAAGLQRLALGLRSEEHTSELQSLMRISYAVFCLKTKITTTNKNTPSKNRLPRYNRSLT